MFLGTASENFPQSPPPRKKFRNVPECFCGLLPKISPKVRLPEKNSGRFPSVFGDCFRKVPPNSTYPKKFGNVPECFWGLLLKISPKVCLPQKTFGNVPECFWGLLPKVSQSPPPRKKFGKVPECFWGLLLKISPKVCLPVKKSGTFPIPYHMSATRKFETTNANAKLAQNHFTTPYRTVRSKRVQNRERKKHIKKKKHVNRNFTGLSRDFWVKFVYVFFSPIRNDG